MANEGASSQPASSSKRRFSVEDFYFHEIIGEGQLTKVWLGTEKKSHAVVAIKVIDAEVRKKNKKELDMYLFLEGIIHGGLKHPNAIRRFLYFHRERTLYYVLEYAANGSLHDILMEHKHRCLPESLASKYIYQISSCLIACHGQGYLHGCIEPKNILIDHHDDAKLSNFKYAGLSHCGLKRGYRGTMEYMAPEALRKGEYDLRVDFWSIGVLCFEILSGHHPFKSKCIKITRDKIERASYNFPPIIGLEAQDLITKLIVVEPAKRLTLDQVISHPWIQKNYLDLMQTEEE